MKKIITLLSLVLCLNTLLAQVGINTNSPDSTLEVVGDIQIDGKLYLENPGVNTQIRGSKLLIQSTDGNIKRYDIGISKYGPINYVQYVFNDLSPNGLLDYDTKVSTDDYLVTIQGYYFLEANTGDTDVMIRSTQDIDNIEGYQIYAYKNTSTNTWFVRAFSNNAQFVNRQGGGFVASPIDMYLNVIIYRDGFITKEQTSITVDMNNLDTGTSPLPTGF